jgi:hypothetical protein
VFGTPTVSSEVPGSILGLEVHYFERCISWVLSICPGKMFGTATTVSCRILSNLLLRIAHRTSLFQKCSPLKRPGLKTSRRRCYGVKWPGTILSQFYPIHNRCSISNVRKHDSKILVRNTRIPRRRTNVELNKIMFQRSSLWRTGLNWIGLGLEGFSSINIEYSLSTLGKKVDWIMETIGFDGVQISYRSCWNLVY